MNLAKYPQLMADLERFQVVEADFNPCDDGPVPNGYQQYTNTPKEITNAHIYTYMQLRDEGLPLHISPLAFDFFGKTINGHVSIHCLPEIMQNISLHDTVRTSYPSYTNFEKDITFGIMEYTLKTRSNGFTNFDEDWPLTTAEIDDILPRAVLTTRLRRYADCIKDEAVYSGDGEGVAFALWPPQVYEDIRAVGHAPLSMEHFAGLAANSIREARGEVTRQPGEDPYACLDEPPRPDPRTFEY